MMNLFTSPRKRESADAPDQGFTLIEVLFVIGLLALVAAVISAAIIVVFRNDDSVVRRTAESHDTQQGVNYFPLDVHAGPVEQALYDTSTTAAGCVAEGQNILQFDKGNKRVAYRLSVSGGVGRLDRHLCDLPLLGNLVRVNIADNLDGAAPQPAQAQLLPPAGVFVDSIELRLVQNDGDALVVASPRAEPRNSPGDCSTNNPIEAAHGFGTFVETDVELQDGLMTGWLGLGGTVTWLSDITVASNNMSGVNPEYGMYAEGVNWDGDRTIIDLDVSANVATAQIHAHGYTSGQLLVIDATGVPAIDGNAFPITVIDSTTFTFPVTTADVSNLTGGALPADAIVDLDIAAAVATATVNAHGYSTGQLVTVGDTGVAAIDGNMFAITVTGANTFTFAVVTPDVVDLTGSARPNDPVELEVGRRKAALGVSFTKIGDLVYESAGSLDNFLNISGPGDPAVDSTASQIDFPTDFDELRDCSAQLGQLLDLCSIAGCANEVTVTVDPIAMTVNACSSSPVPQVLDIPESYFDGTWEFTTSGPGCQGFSQTRPLIINVIDDGDFTVTFDASPVDWTALGDRKNILFNFPNSTAVNINNGFWGHVLAPFAHVTTNGFVEGGVIGRQWTHIDGTIESDDDIFDNPIAWP